MMGRETETSRLRGGLPLNWNPNMRRRPEDSTNMYLNDARSIGSPGPAARPPNTSAEALSPCTSGSLVQPVRLWRIPRELADGKRRSRIRPGT